MAARKPLRGAHHHGGRPARGRPPQPTGLAVAVRVAQLLLAVHEHVDHRDLFAVNREGLGEGALDTETASTSGNAEAYPLPGRPPG